MTRTAGIPFASLFDAADTVNQALPDALSRFVERFVALDLQSRISDGAVHHEGRLQSLDVAIAGQDVESFDLPFGTLKIPMITTGVPFRMALTRAAVTADLEPGAGAWQFDLMLGEFELELDGLTAADYIAENGTTPRHLAPKNGNPPAAIIGSAALRFERTGPNTPVVTRFMDALGGGDPFVPNAGTGAVTNVTLAPPHVLIGSSQFGLTVKNVIFDYSTEFSPAFVLANGQSADWVGLAIEEAAIYCPSNAVGKGGFSLSVRDLLIGDPAGLQAEIEVQFGVSALNPSTFVFSQDGATIPPARFDQDAGTLEITAESDERVALTASLTVPAPPGGSDITDFEAEFLFPGRAPQTGDSATGQVRHGDVIQITPIEVLGADPDAPRRRYPQFSVRMVASGTAPDLSVNVAGTDLDNLVDLTGPQSAINGLVLTATPTPADAAATFAWTSDTLGIETTGSSLTLNIAPGTLGVHLIKLAQTNIEAGTTHLRVRLRDEDSGALLIGCEAGIFAATDPTTALSPSAVLGTYDLNKYHEFGRLEGANGMTTLAGSAVNVPAGGIAEVTFHEGGAPADFKEDRHIQVEFEYAEEAPLRWGEKFPCGNHGDDIHLALVEWAANYAGGKFVIIGRCDDVASDMYNEGLGDRRMNAVRDYLMTAKGGFAAVDVSRLDGHQEQDLSGLDGPSQDLIETLIDVNGDPVEAETSGRLINLLGLSLDWPKRPDGSGDRSTPPDPQREMTRERFRRVDIYAVGSTASGSSHLTRENAIEPTRRQILVPAAGRDVLPADNDAAKADYRVLLKLGWDRPRFSGWEDAVPNLAEFEYAWTPAPADGISTTSQVLTIFGKWVYDDLTGFTEFLIGIKSDGDPDGLFDIDQRNVVAALAFGPMLASGVDFDDDAVGSGVRLAALAAITGFAGADFGDGPLIADGSQTAFTKLVAKTQTRTIADPLASFKVQVLTDYTNTIHVNAGALGLKTDPNQPMKIKYTDVGVEFDNTDPDAPLIQKFGISQSSNSMSIEDSGLWKIDGPLGRLLRITEFKMGTGSLWFEPTLAVAIDIGVVEISEASFRVTFNTDANGDLDGTPEFSLRGLKASVDIPAVVKGEGRIKIEDNGILRAGVDATLIPLQVQASVALAVGIPDDPPDFAPSLFLSLYGRIQFPGGIPLGPLPIAIHGFIGQVTINGTRDVAEVEDVVAREIGWWRKDPEDKYKPEKGQYAFGVGVVIGTLPDASFCFSVTGMVVVAFPDVEVIFGVEVEILSLPITTAKDKKEGDSASITGLVVINEDAVTVAVSATYEIPKLLKLTVPFAAYFPEGGGGYVRIGTDGHPTRPGEPVTLTFLPDTLDVTAWCYVMVEGDGLLSFGPRNDWDFGGFAIGMGAGVDLSWEAGPFELTVSGAIYAGMGTAPLIIRGALVLRGRLDLVIVSASVSADIEVSYIDLPESEPVAALENATFCAEVDLFFFTVSGCISLDFGSAAEFTPPIPDGPLMSVSLTDRTNQIRGEGTTGAPDAAAIYDFVEVDGQSENQGVPPEDNHTVWPDTVPVLNFSHCMTDSIPTGAQFNPSAQPSGEKWSGSNRLRYAYQINDVRLVRRNDGALVTDPAGGPLLSTWTHPPSRPADNAGDFPPSEAETTSLQLLNNEPAAWAQSTANGGAGQPGDPADIIRRICEEVPPPAKACLFGQDGLIQSAGRIRLRRPAPAPGPYPSSFVGIGEAMIELGGVEIAGSDLVSLINAAGGVFEPGTIRPVPATTLATGQATQGYQLPGIAQVTNNGTLRRQALPWRVRLNKQVRMGELTLMVCEPAEGADGGGHDCYTFDDLRIGEKAETFKLDPLTISAIQDPNSNRVSTLEAVDRVDISQVLAPREGSDARAEVQITNPGANIKLQNPCRLVVLHYFNPGPGKLIIRVTHQDGSTTEQTSEAPANRPAEVTIRSASGVVAIELLTDGIKSFYLYRICCEGETPPKPEVERDCIDFGGLKNDIVNRATFTHGGATFETLKASERFSLRDAVDQRPEPDRPGQDGIGDIQLPHGGARVKLPAPCRQLEVSIMLGASPVTITGFDEAGNVVANVTSPATQSIGMTLVLTGSQDIHAIQITGGSGEAFVYRICCVQGGTGPDPKRCVDFDDLPRDFDGQRQVTHQGIGLRPQDRRDVIKLVDQVDSDPAHKPGSDRQAELLIPSRGIELTLPAGCLDAELLVMLFAGSEVTATAFDASGKQVAKDAVSGQGKALTLQLSSKTPIVRIVIEGGSDEAVLLRLCCQTGDVGKPSNTCIDMTGLKPGTKLDEVKIGGIIFRDPRGAKVLVGAKADDKRPARMTFGDAGLQIDLPRSAGSVRLHLLVKKGADYKIEALNAAGKQVAGEGSTAPGTELRLTLTGDDITRLNIEVQGNGALVEICIEETKRKLTIIRDRIRSLADSRADLIALAARQTDATRFPIVEGHDRQTGARANWLGKIISSHPREDGSVCHIVRYDMPAAPQSVDEISVLTQAVGREVTFIGLCAIDDRAAEWHERDEIVRGEHGEDIDGANPLDGRPVVLDPGTEYQIEVEWSYQVFQSEEENEQPPANPDPGAWVPGGVQTYRFATASEDTAIPTRQDGPNEHIFDPRDLDRYLSDSAPANGASHHFTADPVVFHFTQDHVDNLIERYGRDWDIEVRRTDPPPTSGGVPGLGQPPLAGTLSVLLAPMVYLSPADQRMTEAAQDAPCISNDRPVGGTSLAGQFPLEPDVMYDANLWAVRTDDAADRAQVSAANFRTSRYADPTEMIEALGLDVGTAADVAPAPPADLILEAGAALPTGVEPASDQAMDAALNDMGLGTLGLPTDGARVFQIWQPDGGGTMQLKAILVDALEPLNRTAHVIVGNEVRIEERCSLRDGRISGVTLDVVRLSRNSTRALLIPTVSLNNFGPNSFRLRFDTSDGVLTGRRRIRTRPLVMELEGF